MNNALKIFGSSASSVDELNKKLTKSQGNIPTRTSGGLPFLKLDQTDGVWLYGSQGVEVEEMSKWVIDSHSLVHGQSCWLEPSLNGGKREKAGNVMRPIDEPNPVPDIDHSAKGGVWKEQVGCNLVCLSGADKDVEVVYNTDSAAGKEAFYEIFDKIRSRPSNDHIYPIVNLESGSYLNKTWKKKIRTPEFKIVDWSDMDNNLLSAGTTIQVEGKSSEALTMPELKTPENDEETPRRRRRATA